ncbi:site-specific integrase [Bradyrhizobium sp. th.b2]|uniref:tyrosine-type recombinase/integrase n=1 Tax=Bradyrhizobium sp. th-b2 TaxID=172088 RepID=UPI00041EFBDF|nr:site-specific integrase [Bradyrhizobium sp. th.b2]
MARAIHRLNATSAANIAKHGRHADGGGLYLSISPNGGRRWTFLYRWRGKTIELGFGSAPKKGAVSAHVTLADARKLAAAAREMIAKGINPKDAKKPAAGATFGECAERFIENKAPGWRNEKHGAQWRMTLLGVKPDRKAAERDYCARIRPIHVDKITTDDVLDVLRPIWQSKPETASRLRGRIEAVLDAAKVAGHRSGENPARWRGHLEHSLSKRQHLTRGHHAAMTYNDVPPFLIDLRAREAVSASALEFLILTAARTGEAIGARWTEFDLDRGVWTVPPQRMKAGREHRVPLAARALEIVRKMHEVRIGEYVFPGQGENKPLSTMALDMVLRRMKIENATVHGFRSSFRDWAGECTSFPRELAETALAHVIGDKAEQAYRRGDALEKRRVLMESWASYCQNTTNVVQLRSAQQ